MANPWAQLEQELFDAATAEPRDNQRFVTALEQAVQACGTDKRAAKHFELGELYLYLSEEYQALDRYDDALVAADQAVEAGLELTPDARCLRAEILMRTGRIAEAEPIWAAVLADTPDDVWLYNNAGLEYAETGDHVTALDWLTKGLQLALATGDPEGAADQLYELRQESLEHLGESADELQQQAEEFLDALEQDHPEWPMPAEDSPIDPFDKMVLAWLPAGDYDDALAAWPEFAATELMAGSAGPLPHSTYCVALQQRLEELSEAGFPTLVIAPLSVAAFTAWCAEADRDPDSAESRIGYAEHLAITDAASLISWPPGRNDPCWCGSGRKYKKCCAAPGAMAAV